MSKRRDLMLIMRGRGGNCSTHTLLLLLVYKTEIPYTWKAKPRATSYARQLLPSLWSLLKRTELDMEYTLGKATWSN